MSSTPRGTGSTTPGGPGGAGRRRVGFVINPIKFDDLQGAREEADTICRILGWDAPLWRQTTEADPGACLLYTSPSPRDRG